MGNFLNIVSCIYANVLSSSHCQLWQELSDIPNLSISNWFAIGDYNACFGAHEKTGLPPFRRSYFEFIKAVEDYNLTTLDTKGPFYTWSNNCRGRDRVDIRLDRVLYNSFSL